MVSDKTLQKIEFVAYLLWLAVVILALTMSGCTMHTRLIGAEASINFLKDQPVRETLNVQSGNQSSLETEDSNPFTEKLKYKQLTNQPKKLNE